MAHRALESRRRRDERQTGLNNEIDIADAAVAASEISSLMEQFTSSKLGTNSTILNASSTDSSAFGLGGVYGRQQFMDVDDEDKDDSYDNDYDTSTYPNSPDPVAWIRQQDAMDERKRRIKQQEQKNQQFLPNSTMTSNETTPHRRLLLASHPAGSMLLKNQPMSVSKQNQSSKFLQTPTPAPLDRALTPVMSNSSSRGVKRDQQKQRQVPQFLLPPSSSLKLSKDDAYVGDIYDNGNEEEEDEEMPVNVQSPWVTNAATRTPNVRSVQRNNNITMMQRTTNNPTTSMEQTTSSTGTIYSPTIVFDRYYDAVCTFVKSKHSNILLAYSATPSTTTIADETGPGTMMTADGEERPYSNSLSLTTINNNASSSSLSFARMHQERECRTDVDFLHKLFDIATNVGSGKDSSISTSNKSTTSSILQNHKEANFWHLLALLRPLGVDAILNEDDRSSFIQHQHSIQGYIQRLASQFVEYTPEHLWNHYHESIMNGSGNGPFLLKRRQKIVQWLEYCFNETLPYALKKPSSSQTPYVLRDVSSSSQDSVGQPQQQLQYQKHLSMQGFQCGTNDTVLLQHSLSYILAGRLHDAQELVRANDSSWRAALWDGGKPYGYIVEEENNNNKIVAVSEKNTTRTTGNPNRALWRRMTWKLADSYSNTTTTTSSIGNNNGGTVIVYEAAIAAILSSNVSSALDNPVLNGSWEQGLYVVYKSLLDRTIDELFHYHNNDRRQQTKTKHPFCMSYPYVFESERYEREQLQVTSNVTVLDDSNVMELLSSRPYLQQMLMQRQKTTTTKEDGFDLVTDATISIFIGKSALSTLIDTTSNEYGNSNNHMNYDDDRTVEYLRFLTHLALYLDSLSVTTTTTTTTITPTTNKYTGTLWTMISEWKNMLLIQYIHYLSTHYELTRMMIVYASLLPEPLVVDVLPSVLVPIESFQQRKGMVQQLKEYLAVRKHGLDLDILRLVVRRMIRLESNNNGNHTDTGDNDDDDLYNVRTIVHYNQHPNHDDDDGYDSSSPSTMITRTDLKKMYSILWLTFNEEHVGEALICTNTLLRQFLFPHHETNHNNGKLHEAKVFLRTILPSNLIHRVQSFQQQDQQSTDNTMRMHQRKVEYAISDYLAIQEYLDAIDALGEWMETMMSLNDSAVVKKNSIIGHGKDGTNNDKNQWNRSERAIATRTEWYQFLESKRSVTAAVIVATHAVESLLYKLLTYPGGWLFTDDEVSNSTKDDDGVVDDDDEETLVRRQELRHLRSILLPRLVGSYENVCSTTATWMSTSLNDALEQYEWYQKQTTTNQQQPNSDDGGVAVVQEEEEEKDRTDLETYMIQLLDETATTTTMTAAAASSSSLSSPVSPRYWIQKIFHLASICTSDTYGIQSAYEEDCQPILDDYNNNNENTSKKSMEEYEDLIASMVDATISDLLLSSTAVAM